MTQELSETLLTADELDWLIEWSLETADRALYRNYFFNFRVDTETEECVYCGDAAHWPSRPGLGRYVGPLFEVEVYNEDGEFDHYDSFYDADD